MSMKRAGAFSSGLLLNLAVAIKLNALLGGNVPQAAGGAVVVNVA
jgi:hypothetical protein